MYNGMFTRVEKKLMNRAGNTDTRTEARKKAIEVEQKAVEMCAELYEAAGVEPPNSLRPPSMPNNPRRRLGGDRLKSLMVSRLEAFKRAIGAGVEKDAVETCSMEHRKRKRDEDEDDAAR